MPELPEVETMRLGILSACGARVVSARQCRCRKKPITTDPSWRSIARYIARRKISEIDRHGKRLLLHFDNDYALMIEPRMTGLVLIEDPPTWEHLRWEIRLGGDCSQLRYWDRRGLGQVRLFSKDELTRILTTRIGPDALTITAKQFQNNLSARRTPIKVGLLDQAALAGIGNIYASEMLHRSRIHPQVRCDRLRPRQWEDLFRQMREVLRKAISHEGSTLGDGTYRNALGTAGSFQHQHQVYDRAGDVCLTCRKGIICRIVQAQRSTFFCPRCQKVGRGRDEAK